MVIDVIVEEARWSEVGFQSIAAKSASAALERLGLKATSFDIAILGCNDARISELNNAFRDKPQPTNVLSWPFEDLSHQEDGAVPTEPSDRELGDIAIAYETCAREARDFGRSLEDHTSHMIVHGTLHLLGYDHTRPNDAALMERLEVEILATLGVPDPY